MELTKYDKNKEKLNNLLAYLGTLDFDAGETYIHPPLDKEPFHTKEQMIYFRDRVYAVIRAEKREMIKAGHPELCASLDRFTISMEDDRLVFKKKRVSPIYDTLEDIEISED